MTDLDDLDRALLRAARSLGSLNAGQLGEKVGLSQPAAWRRLRRLREIGVITGQHVRVDAEKAGFGVTVLVGVKLAARGTAVMGDFERAVQAIPEVLVVQHVLGLFDYRLRIVARDLEDFERILRRRVMTLPGVGAVESNIVLSEERRPLPI
ncbi:Lrp/AsnC family transcriptional regulator [Paracoccaceae bacterium GXU_MW_L88]